MSFIIIIIIIIKNCYHNIYIYIYEPGPRNPTPPQWYPPPTPNHPHPPKT